MFEDRTLDRPTYSDLVLEDLALLMTGGGTVAEGVEDADLGRPIRDQTGAVAVSSSDEGDENPNHSGRLYVFWAIRRS